MLHAYQCTGPITITSSSLHEHQRLSLADAVHAAPLGLQQRLHHHHHTKELGLAAVPFGQNLWLPDTNLETPQCPEPRRAPVPWGSCSGTTWRVVAALHQRRQRSLMGWPRLSCGRQVLRLLRLLLWAAMGLYAACVCTVQATAPHNSCTCVSSTATDDGHGTRRNTS